MSYLNKPEHSLLGCVAAYLAAVNIGLYTE